MGNVILSNVFMSTVLLADNVATD